MVLHEDMRAASMHLRVEGGCTFFNELGFLEVEIVVVCVSMFY